MKNAFKWALVIGLCWWAFKEDGLLSRLDKARKAGDGSPTAAIQGLFTSGDGGGGTGEGQTKTPPPPPRKTELTAEQRRAMAAWGAGEKRACVVQSAELAERLAARQSGGYSYGTASLSKARAALQALDRSIDRDDWQGTPRRLEEAREAVRLFEAGCRWTPGARHSNYPHIRADVREGYWNADNGWTFLQDGSLEVARICPRCGGDGLVSGWCTCPQCNGEGSVETTLTRATSFIDNVSDGIEAVGKFLEAIDDASHHRSSSGRGRSGGGGHRATQGIRCNACNGRGRVECPETCSRCDGTGYLR